MARIFFRWLTSRPDRYYCYDCDRELSRKALPHLRVTHVTQDYDRVVIRPQALCKSCWVIYQGRTDQSPGVM